MFLTKYHVFGMPNDMQRGLWEVTYPLGLDPGANIYAKYALRKSGITRNILIYKDGTIIKRTRLYKEDEFSSLVETIDKYLK